jgi:hypothetical protein
MGFGRPLNARLEKKHNFSAIVFKCVFDSALGS